MIDDTPILKIVPKIRIHKGISKFSPYKIEKTLNKRD